MEANTGTAPAPSPSITTNDDNNGKVFTNSAEPREEGELSGSENEEFAGSQFPDSTIVPEEPSEVVPLNKYTHTVEIGKSAPLQNPTKSAGVALRTSVKSNNQKVNEKYRVPFLISFSDDDSGSDSEEHRQGNTIESDDTARGVAESRKLFTKIENSQMARQIARDNTKIPKKVSMSSIFVPSTNRTNGTSSRNDGHKLVGLKSHPRKTGAPNKNKASQNVHVNSSKLQDLRQLIAIRENELKSRAAKHDKDIASGSFKNRTPLIPKNAATRSTDSAECFLDEPKQLEKKRLKVSEPHIDSLLSVRQYGTPSTESILAKNSASESRDQKAGDNSISGDKETQLVIGQSCAMQRRKKVKINDIPSTNLPLGTHVIRNNRWHDRFEELAESSEPLATDTATTSPQKQECLNNSSFRNRCGNMNTGDVDIQSLLEIEELHDKELNEAQEHRRKCEIEERNALKAYRKAQRALSEANTACSYLFRKRELFSAQLRSHMMEDSNFFCSKIPHEQIFSLRDQLQYGLNSRTIDGGLDNSSDLHECGENLISEPCSEPDTITSEPEDEKKVNDVCSPLHEKNDLAEDERTSAFDLKAGESSVDCQLEGISNEVVKGKNDEPVSVETTAEDSLLLEATLRSQLFARLGIKNKTGPSQNMEPRVEREDGEIMEGIENMPSSGAEKGQLYDFEDIGRSGEGTPEHPMDIKKQCHIEMVLNKYESSSMTEPILRSAFGHVKVSYMINPTATKNLPIHNNDIYDVKEAVGGVCGAVPTDMVSETNEWSLDMRVSEVGSYSNNLAINPFWPLCMFELRGKCNDDECPWQHVRDYSSRRIDDNVVKSSLRSGNDATTNSKCLNSLPLVPPTYLVCVDILKADLHPYRHLLAQTVGQLWQKSFSASLVVSSSFLSDLHSDEPCLHGPETRIEVHEGWNRQSSYFHWKNVKEGLPDQHMDDTDQALEIALLSITREVNKQKGRKESLRVLARALEEHPTSVLLWIVYLHIYYSNKKSIREDEDDLFRYAVDHNEESYELWLMFINNRDKLDDRLLAYDSALLALCHASAPDMDSALASQCILDLFLQKMNFFCFSGEVDRAIQQLSQLFHSTTRSNDIHTCLTIPDKCIFWICCVYLVIYKKLPDTIVHQFECPKEVSLIEWYPVNLTAEERRQAVTLMELAVDSLASYINSQSLESKTTLKAAQLFALNHIRCMSILEGFDCSKNLLIKYIQLYPFYLELVLMSIRAKESESIDATHKAFEEALSNWNGERGLQCIWNQYIEYTLQNGRVDFAKELMARWFDSESSNVDVQKSNLSQTDLAFGLLNLALYEELQNKHTEARVAIEQALEVASVEDYRHIVSEHAVFLLKNGSNFYNDSLNGVSKTLNIYLNDSRASPPLEPISRTFIRTIKKPKLQQLVNSLLSPVSSDTSLLNAILESCFGPSLAPPQDFERPRDLNNLVDFAEAVMEIRPANYRLALSVCKRLLGNKISPGISFWASSLLINSLFQAVPVAPEFVWLEAASTLKNLTEIRPVLESFHKRALSVYPHSTRLWKSCLGLATTADQVNAVIQLAREKGIKLD